ncbi:MAG TPA: phospholipase D-like domain-containing protein [Bryobacteraceae bacterium]|nr:phospholipase D-like domain-containing protein [Bryobacteraceae bacterium]
MSSLGELYRKWRGGGRPRHRNFQLLFYLSMVALVIQTALLFLALFEPPLPYKVSEAAAEKLDSPEFAHVLSALSRGVLRHYDSIEVLTNGESYYPNELDAIRGARHSINLEAYIFKDGKVAREFVRTLVERAKAGVKVNLLVDALGSPTMTSEKLKPLTDAGGRAAWYNSVRWYTWPNINNRTHRELVIIDGTIGFIGGAGWADHWLHREKDDPRWRDTMVRVSGEIVTGLQSAFAENWLEATGEILTGREYFPMVRPAGSDKALIVASAPSSGRSTEARVLFQTLLASAQRRIWITTPYFLPDAGIRKELIRAIKERHVDVQILVPGHRSDHAMTRNSSRALYGELLQNGAKIYEYQPAMIHAKTLVVDSLWSVAGSTNMDSRSFNINDEINLAVADTTVAARLEQDFRNDVSQSHQITYDQWKRRPMIERAQEWFGSLYQRQQ